MDRINANTYRGSLTIVGRPELRLGYPVYIKSRDIYGYIENISHNFSFGGPFTSQIHLVAIRKKYLGDDPKSEGYLYEDTEAKNLRGDSAILVRVGDDNFTDYSKLSNLRKPAADHNIVDHKDRERSSGLRTNRAGNYKEFSLKHSKAKDILKKMDIAKASRNTNSYLSFLDSAIPISDELGYELIGTFEYGRTLFLNAQGTIKKKAQSFSQLLAKNLKKANKLSDYEGNISVSEFKQLTDTEDASATLQSDEKTINTQANTAKEVSDFYRHKSFKLADIAPDRDKAIGVGCSCFDADLKTKPYQDKNPSNKQTIISNVNRKK